MKTAQTFALVGLLTIGSLSLWAAGTGTAAKAETKASLEVVPVSEVEWQKLNPARGDQSPQAGTLWGDRQGPVPTGFLAKFADGFSSPPHIHNATYRAVVISGLIHNDDPDAADMWMPVGSFWTQPKGEVHITAAKGETNVALVEIDQGPYLVRPPDDAFDSGERPVNVDASNIVWVDPPGMPTSENGPKVAYLWGNPQSGSNGTFIRLPAGTAAELHSHGSTLRVVVITGQLQYQGTKNQTLDPGSYLGSEGDWVHHISSSSDAETIVYVRSEGKYELTSGADSPAAE